jgi:hypothetical protein
MTFIQASVFQAIFAWFTFIPLALLHFLSIEGSYKFIHDNRNGFWIAYYFLQFVWYFGIIVDFYQL